MMKRYKNNSILVISDTHLPYQDRRMLAFLKRVRDSFKPDRVIHTGDLVDNYNISRYSKDPDHPHSWQEEMNRVRAEVTKLANIFPRMDLMIGNHDERYYNKAKSSGIPTSIIKGFPEVIGVTNKKRIKWNFHESLTITVDATRERITFAHHRGANTLLVAQRLGRTFVAGHIHSKGSVQGFNNGDKTYFGVTVPCLISNVGAPFSYTKISNINPVRGCVLIEEGTPRIIKLS